MSVFKNVVPGFSLVLHDPKGSHYNRNSLCCGSMVVDCPSLCYP